MRAIAPRTGGEEHTLAENQTEYSPITIAVHRDPAWGDARIFVSRWTLTDQERASLLAGEDIYVGVLLGSKDFMPPLHVEVGPGNYQTAVPE